MCPTCHTIHQVARLGAPLGVLRKEGECPPSCSRPKVEAKQVQRLRLASLLRHTLLDIGARLHGLEQELGRVRASKQGREEEVLKRMVSNYYLAHREEVMRHEKVLEARVSRHQQETTMLLLSEELRLEQARDDLRELAGKVEEWLKQGEMIQVTLLKLTCRPAYIRHMLRLAPQDPTVPTKITWA